MLRETIVAWRAIHAALCFSAGRARSVTMSTTASQIPSAIASIFLCATRSAGAPGISAGGASSVSRYSTITLESCTTRPSSSTSAGALPSGLTAMFVCHGFCTRTSCSSFFSISATRALRAKGLGVAMMSFTSVPKSRPG